MKICRQSRIFDQDNPYNVNNEHQKIIDTRIMYAGMNIGNHNHSQSIAKFKQWFDS